MQQLQEKHQARRKKLYYAFVDFENGGGEIDFEEAGCGREAQRTVIALYTEDCTEFKTDAGLSESFDVKVGLY